MHASRLYKPKPYECVDAQVEGLLLWAFIPNGLALGQLESSLASRAGTQQALSVGAVGGLEAWIASVTAPEQTFTFRDWGPPRTLLPSSHIAVFRSPAGLSTSAIHNPLLSFCPITLQTCHHSLLTDEGLQPLAVSSGSYRLGSFQSP